MYLTVPAAKWLVARGTCLAGTDSLSADRVENESLDVHRVFLANGVVVVENLELRMVEPRLYRLIYLPLKLTGCDGAPASVVLMKGINNWSEEGKPCW